MYCGIPIIVEMRKIYFGNIPIGKKFPMFGISRNNIAETVANTSKWSKIRSTIRPISISIWISYSLKILEEYKKRINSNFEGMVPYSSIGTRCIADNKRRMKVMEADNKKEYGNVVIVIINEKAGKKS